MNRKNRKEIIRIALQNILKELLVKAAALKHEETMKHFAFAETQEAQAKACEKARQEYEHLKALEDEAKEMWKELR